MSNGGTYSVQSVNNESTYPIRGAALHRCAPIWESCALNCCIHHAPATALGQLLSKQPLCIVIRSFTPCQPGHVQGTLNISVWLRAEQVSSVKGKDGGRCLKYANISFAVDFTQFCYLMRFLMPET